jgi:4-amino-4-deoxy-L-arabinose transferase-like glycosyltransferase
VKKLIAGIVFIAAALFLFLFRIHEIPLWSSDEGRYGSIAREMWENKDFIVPQFNHADYLDKPVLAPALTALAYGLFGVNNFTTRSIPVVAAILGLLMTYFFTRRLFGRERAFLTVVILMTSIGYVLVGRFAVIDMLMTFVMSASLFCLMTASLGERREYYLLAYVFIGLAFLTKGLIGIVLPGLIFLIYLIWTKNLAEIKKMRLVWGILIVGAIILPWCVAISVREPEFFDTFIVKQHFNRFATGSFGRRRPFWFFVPIFFALAFPWSLFFPAAVSHSLKQKTPDLPKYKFLISWILVIFGFFSIPKSKLPYYLLPLSIPVAILTACFFDAYFSEKKFQNRFLDRFLRGVWILIPTVCFLLPVGIFVYMLIGAKLPEFYALKPILIAAACLFFAAGAALVYFRKKERLRPAFFTLAGLVFFGLTLAVLGMKVITPYQSTYDYAELIKTTLKPEDRVAVYSSPDRFSDLPFHLKRRIIVVGADRGTLSETSRDPDDAEEMKGWFLDNGVFAAEFNKREIRYFCLTEIEKFHEVEEAGVKDYKILKKDHGMILISNQ